MPGSDSALRELVEFALNRDVDEEISRQLELSASDPELALPHFNLGILYYSQRRVQESIRSFETAICLDPTHGRAYRKLGEVYLNIGEYEVAGKFAVKAATLGDRTLLDAFARYPAMKCYVEDPKPAA